MNSDCVPVCVLLLRLQTGFANDSLNEIYAETTGGESGIEGSMWGAQKVMKVIVDLCEDYRSELRVLRGQSVENQGRRLCERLFRRYYTAIRSRLLLEISSELGPHLTVDDLVNKPMSLIVRAINFVERLKELISREELSAFEGPGGEGLDNYLCPMETFTAAIVSTTIKLVDDAWTGEIQKYQHRIRAVRPRGGSAASFGATLLDLSTSSNLSSTRNLKEVPPRLSVIFGAIDDVFDALTPLDDSKATFLRRKVFTSCILFVSGNFQSIQPKNDLPNLSGETERYIGAMLKDLDQCTYHLERMREEWSASCVVPEISEVFISASQKFMTAFSKLFVQRFFDNDESLPKLFSLLFNSALWANGEATTTLISKCRLFLNMKQEEVPASLHAAVEMRLLRGFLLR